MPSQSLATLTNSGETIIVGDKAFTDFSVTGYNAANLYVEGIQLTGNYGISFIGPINNLGDNEMDVYLMYQVFVTNSLNLISQANLSFDGNIVGTGFASVVEQVFTNDTYYSTMGVDVVTPGNFSNSSTSMAINPPQELLDISKDVQTEAIIPGGASYISDIDQTYTQVSEVPEPSTIMLAVAGLAGLLLLRRRRR